MLDLGNRERPRVPAVAGTLRRGACARPAQSRRVVRARRPRSLTRGHPLGEAFTFLSGLYFRGKLAYARQFGVAAGSQCARDHDEPRPACPGRARAPRDLVAFSRVDIAGADPRFVKPLRRSAETLAASLESDVCVVLLGSIATGKYVGHVARGVRRPAPLSDGLRRARAT